MFLGEIAASLVESQNHSFSAGELSTSQKQVVIKLIKGRLGTTDLSKIGDLSLP